MATQTANMPLTPKVDVALDDPNRILTVNGVRISYDFLVTLTSTSPEGRWYRFERNGNSVTVVCKFGKDPHDE